MRRASQLTEIEPPEVCVNRGSDDRVVRPGHSVRTPADRSPAFVCSNGLCVGCVAPGVASPDRASGSVNIRTWKGVSSGRRARIGDVDYSLLLDVWIG